MDSSVTEWKKAYRATTKAFPKLFKSLPKSSRKLSATFPCGVGVGVGKIPPTPFSEISPEQEVSVRLFEKSEDGDGLGWLTREQVLSLLKQATDYLEFEFPEDHAEWSIYSLGRYLEVLNEHIDGWWPSPWSKNYDSANYWRDWLAFAERNALDPDSPLLECDTSAFVNATMHQATRQLQLKEAA